MRNGELKLFLVPLITIFLLASCASAGKKADVLEIRLERTVDANAPKTVKDAVRNAPADMLVGVGSARVANLSAAMTMAQVQAYADIARQINLVTTQIVRYYVRTSQTDPSVEETFRETITTQVSQANLKGAFPAARVQDEDDRWWLVVTVDRSALADNLSEAQIPAKTKTPEMAAFDAETLVKSAVFIPK